MKKILVAAVFLLAYFGGFAYFSTHYYPNTRINGLLAGRKTPKEVLEKDREQIKKYSILVHQLEGDQSFNDVLEVGQTDAYEKILKNQKAFLFPVRVFGKHEENCDVYQVNETAFQDMIKNLHAVKNMGKEEPVDAKLQYDKETKRYQVIEEKLGSIKDKKKVKKAIRKALEERKTEVDLTDCYSKPKITKDSPKLLVAKEKLDKNLSTTITYKRNDHKIILDADTIHDFLCWDKNFDTWISEEKVRNWVDKTLAKEFDTLGQTRKMNSPGSGKFEVSGGTFGYLVSRDSETDTLIEEIRKGESKKREPKYALTGKVGNSYVDISLSDQKLWVIKDGKVKLSSPLVSGNVSTGHSTKTGVYYVEYKTTNYTMRKYNAFVRYWMPFDTGEGVGMHDADWRGSFGGDIYRYNGSHGCINLPVSKAREIYSMVPTNYPVVVHW